MPTLDWIGKRAVLTHHREVPYRLLHCDKAASAGNADAGNLLVQGDNLLALKALLPYYAGKVKCIYIDPPYNTGNENWVYNDNVNSPEIRKWLGQVVGGEAEDLSRHDKWLCMMYPRLSLLKQFLTEDGAIFVSMDDHEIHALRYVLNEVFGPQRFVATIVWQKRYSRENRGSIGDAHEYILVYARDPYRFKQTRHRVPLDEKQAAIYKNLNNNPRGRWRAIPMNAQGWRPNQMYEITTPTGKLMKPPKGRCWSLIEPEFKKLLDAGRIWFGKNGNSAPGIIRFLDEVEGLVPWTWWPHQEVGHTDEAKKELNEFLSDISIFDTPKPTRLIRRILEIATDKHSLILDSFAGSGTTGHAVLALNQADGGNRRFILVEMDEKICRDVTAQRLTRVIEGHVGRVESSRPAGRTRDDAGDVRPTAAGLEDSTRPTTATKTEGLGGGYRYCKLGEPLFDEHGQISAPVTFPDLAAHIFFTETGSPIPKRANGKTPLLGVHNGKAVYLLFNGVLGDKRPNGGNVLTGDVLRDLPKHDGPRVVYGTGCRLGETRLRRCGVVFKQVPYQIQVS